MRIYYLVSAGVLPELETLGAWNCIRLDPLCPS